MVPVLVAGASGFLGQGICETLEKDRGYHRVIRVATAECDLTDAEAVRSLAGTVGEVAAVFLAGKSPYHGIDPDLFRVNGVQVSNFLSAFAEKLASFVYMSSADVYGPTPQLPITEQTVLAPVTPYATSKLVCEYVAYQYSAQFPVTIFRVASAYGWRDGGKRAIVGRLLRAILNDDMVTITGDGSQVRELTHAADIANVVADCVSRPRQGIFNLTSGLRYTINDIVGILERASGKQVQRVYQPSVQVVSQHFDNANLISGFPGCSFRKLEDTAGELVSAMTKLSQSLDE